VSLFSNKILLPARLAEGQNFGVFHEDNREYSLASLGVTVVRFSEKNEALKAAAEFIGRLREYGNSSAGEFTPTAIQEAGVEGWTPVARYNLDDCPRGAKIVQGRGEYGALFTGPSPIYPHMNLRDSYLMQPHRPTFDWPTNCTVYALRGHNCPVFFRDEES